MLLTNYNQTVAKESNLIFYNLLGHKGWFFKTFDFTEQTLKTVTFLKVINEVYFIKINIVLSIRRQQPNHFL